MRFQHFLGWCLLIAFGMGAFQHSPAVQADEIHPAPASQVSAYELIMAMNTLRVSYGLPALIEDPIVDAVAQSTAATMAANHMSWHIGNARGRLAAAGYGNGGTVWATENFAVSGGSMGIDEIMAVWSDPDHMRPATEAAYCNIGAGAAQTSDGKIYYILQAAYVAGQACGSSPSSSSGGTSPLPPRSGAASQPVIPVATVTPDSEGRIYHVVQTGQSFWSIAIAYQITIKDLESWNNLSRNAPLRAGQRLFIPNRALEGYATPTPFGMIVPQTPDAEGRIIHEVQPYQALSTIAEAYHISVNRILALNGLQETWPLQIGQKLLISPGNITPSPTLNAIQRLTPAADGKYYHTVQSGETLSGIAGLYNVQLSELIRTNGLDDTSIIHPGQKMLLPVTLPATPTPPPTPTPTPRPATSTPLPFPSLTEPQSTETQPAVITTEPPQGSSLSFILGVTALVVAGLLVWRFSRRS
jgi:LysM repeat protein